MTSFPALAKLLPTLPSFLPPNVPPRTIEIVSLLGPFFGRLSSLPDGDPEMSKHYFSGGNVEIDVDDDNPDSRSPIGEWLNGRRWGDVKASMEVVRSAVSSVVTGLFEIINQLVRAGPDTREEILNYVSKVAYYNIGRGKMRVSFS